MKVWSQDTERDVTLLRAGLIGGIEAIRAAAMQMPEFAGGPDVVTSYARWMALPSRKPYRLEVATAYYERYGHELQPELPRKEK